jgi:hypothetical protein
VIVEIAAGPSFMYSIGVPPKLLVRKRYQAERMLIVRTANAKPPAIKRFVRWVLI